MKTFEEKIIEILNRDKNLECNYDFTQEKEKDCLINLCSNIAKAKEIASMMKEFMDWVMENEYFYGKLSEEILTPLLDLPEFKTTDELFDYWLKNIKKCQE